MGLRFRGRRQKKQEFYLELNSLMDVLFILLVFLIKNYSANNLNIPENIVLPHSVASKQINQAIVIQLTSEKKLYLNDILVADLEKDKELADGNIITALYDKMVDAKQNIKYKAKTLGDIHGTDEIVNLLMDKNLPYKYIRKIMFTSQTAGFKEFKFIVEGKE